MEKSIMKLPGIKETTDLSEPGIQRMRINFKNGYGLSIVRGAFTFGGSEGLYEIAPLNRDGRLDGTLFDEEDQGGDVCGYCDKEKVMRYVRKIGGDYGQGDQV